MLLIYSVMFPSLRFLLRTSYCNLGEKGLCFRHPAGGFEWSPPPLSPMNSNLSINVWFDLARSPSTHGWPPSPTSNVFMPQCSTWQLSSPSPSWANYSAMFTPSGQQMRPKIANWHCKPFFIFFPLIAVSFDAVEEKKWKNPKWHCMPLWTLRRGRFLAKEVGISLFWQEGKCPGN